MKIKQAVACWRCPFNNKDGCYEQENCPDEEFEVFEFTYWKLNEDGEPSATVVSSCRQIVITSSSIIVTDISGFIHQFSLFHMHSWGVNS